MDTLTGRRVSGFCPMGCGETLFVAEGGHVTCSYLSCPRPDAVDDLLSDRETDHVVHFGADTFTVKHPLRERLDDELLRCQLHEFIRSLPGPPVAPGRYRAFLEDGSWRWALLGNQ